MRKELKSVTPRIRLTGQQFEGDKEISFKRNDNGFLYSELPLCYVLKMQGVQDGWH